MIRYDIKSVRKISDPILRIDSKNCSLWHKLARNANIFEKDMPAVLCQPCKRLRSDLEQRLKTSTMTPEEKENRVQPSSHYPVKYLSPASMKKKKQNTQLERSSDKKKLKKYEYTDLILSDEQHEQMCEIMQKIDEYGSEDLADLLSTRDEDTREVIKGLWENDKRNVQREFQRDQRANGMLCSM